VYDHTHIHHAVRAHAWSSIRDFGPRGIQCTVDYCVFERGRFEGYILCTRVLLLLLLLLLLCEVSQRLLKRYYCAAIVSNKRCVTECAESPNEPSKAQRLHALCIPSTEIYYLPTDVQTTSFWEGVGTVGGPGEEWWKKF